VSGTLFSLDLLNAPIGLALAGLVGVAFGYFLEVAGFGSSRKLTAVFYLRDMAVVKVMFTAVVVAMVGLTLLTGLGWLNLEDVHGLETFWLAQILGGLVLGAGFVIGGWCPGTAIVGAVSAKLDALVFLGGAVLGSIVFNEAFDLIEPLYEGYGSGLVFLNETLGLHRPVLVLIFCLAALACLAGATRLEARLAGLPLPDALTAKRRRTAAALLLGAGLLGLVLPGPEPPQPGAATGQADNVLAAVSRAEDHIEPLALAQAMMSGKPELLVVDIRPPEDFKRFHLRGAIHVPLETLLARAGSELPRQKLLVLVSNGTTHAAQAWIALRQAGWTNARVLTDGLLGFWRACLTPPSLAGGTDAAAAQAAQAGFAARKAFFLGQAPPQVPAKAPAPEVAALEEPGLERHVVSTAWLGARLGDPHLKILDVRASGTAYTKGHLPRALYFAYEGFRTTVDGIPAMLMPAEDIARILGRLGIRPDDTVVICADALRDATLAAMALQRVGHNSFAILHGGWAKWIAENRPATQELTPSTATVYAPAAGADTFTVTTDQVKAALDAGKTIILDVRPPEYFAGQKSEEARAGHIPGAVNREFKLDLVPGKELWQSADVLAKAYGQLGILPDSSVIVHCRTGHQASQTWFLLRHVLGFANVKWYDASWSHWAARADLPVAKQ